MPMDYASSSRACSLLTTARALLQERRVTHCGMPHCDMPQLHRFPPDTIVNSVACEDTRSAPRRISPESRRGSRVAALRLCRRICGLAYARLRVQSVPARRAPWRGAGCQYVSTVSLSL